MLAALPDSRRPSATPSASVDGAPPSTAAAHVAPKRRLRWTPSLHAAFLDAVQRLGGADAATPATIRRVMCSAARGGASGGANADTGAHLSLTHLKSHLQKHRLAMKAEAGGRGRGDGDAGPSRGASSMDGAPPPPPPHPPTPRPPPVAVTLTDALAGPSAPAPPAWTAPPPLALRLSSSAVLDELRAALTEQAGLQCRLHALKEEQTAQQRCLAAQAARAARLVAALQAAPATGGVPPFPLHQPQRSPVPDAPRGTVLADPPPLKAGGALASARRSERQRAALA